MSKPDTISVRTLAEDEINADSADLRVVVSGESLFSGEEAFKKAKEVRELVAALHEAGIEEWQIKLRSVQLESSILTLIKSSTASYTLSIKKVSLQKLPDVLGAISQRKKAKLNFLEWNYGKADETVERLRKEALKKALSNAKQCALVLGVEILGIYSLVEDRRDGSDYYHNREYATFDDDYMLSASRRKKSVDLGFVLGNSSTVKVSLNAEFRVSSMNTSSDN